MRSSFVKQMMPIVVLSTGIFGLTLAYLVISDLRYGIIDWEFLVGALIMLVLALLSGTSVSRQTRLDNQRKLQDKVNALEAAGGSVSASDKAAADVMIPSYAQLLKRNGLVTAVYLPLLIAIVLLCIWAYTQLLHLSDKNAAKSLITIALSLGFALAFFAWRLVAAFVDRRWFPIKRSESPSPSDGLVQ